MINIESLSFFQRMRLLFFARNPSVKTIERIIEAPKKEPTLAQVICSSLKVDSDQWKIDHYTITHKNGTRIWICNGVDYVRVVNDYSNVIAEFSSQEKKFIWKAIQEWKSSVGESQQNEVRASLIKKFSGTKAESHALSKTW